jgi:hypothetical protein
MLGNRRSRRVRAGFALAATVLVVVLGGAVALACVPQAYLVTLRPNSWGPAGSEVTVNGFNLDQGPAEVRWNGVDGPLLGQAEGPNISVPVTIPGVSTGLYAVVVISRQPSGGIGNTASVPFQVTAPGDVANDLGTPVEPGDPSTTGVPRVVASRSPVETWLTLAVGAMLSGVGFIAGSFLGRRRGAKARPS